MSSNSEVEIKRVEIHIPGLASRIYSVWYRHYRVYTKNLISNGFPPFLEPLLFSFFYAVIFIFVFTVLAIYRLKKRIIG